MIPKNLGCATRRHTPEVGAAEDGRGLWSPMSPNARDMGYPCLLLMGPVPPANLPIYFGTELRRAPTPANMGRQTNKELGG